MKLICITSAALCLLLAYVSGAEESANPSVTSGDVKVSNLEQDDHGPLMKALLNPGEGTSTLNRQKRTLKYGKPSYSGGGCCSGCGGCGGGGGSNTAWATSSSKAGSSSRG